MVAKLTGHVLTVLVREKATLRLVRCLELPSQHLDDVAAVLLPTFVYVEDNLGGRAEHLILCGFGAADGRSAAPLPGGIGRGSGTDAVAAGSARREQRRTAGVSAQYRQE